MELVQKCSTILKEVFEEERGEAKFRELYIVNLKPDTTGEKLKNYFSKWGQVLQSAIMPETATVRSYTQKFCVITYSKKSEVDKAMANRPHIIDDHTFYSFRILPKLNPNLIGVTRRLITFWVEGGNNIERVLKNYYSKFGNILKLELIPIETVGNIGKVALIVFDDYDSVDECILQGVHMIDNSHYYVRKVLGDHEFRLERHNVEE